jgi:hypothetical protein
VKDSASGFRNGVEGPRPGWSTGILSAPTVSVSVSVGRNNTSFSVWVSLSIWEYTTLSHTCLAGWDF